MPKNKDSSPSDSIANSAAAGRADTVACPSCHVRNPVGGRYCSVCGASLVPHQPIPVPDASHHSISEEIDSRRARQLLDKALHLAERGDLPAAILACRQSIALSPQSVTGHSMLGMLLERSGDIIHAIQSYERVLQIAPSSPMEREALMRLREQQIQAGDGAVAPEASAPAAAAKPAKPAAEANVQAAAVAATPLPSPASPPAPATAPATAPAAPAAPAAPPAGTPAPAAASSAATSSAVTSPVSTPETATAPSSSAEGVQLSESQASQAETSGPRDRRQTERGNERRGRDRRQVQIPVAVERRRTSDRRGPRETVPAPARTARPSSAAQAPIPRHAPTPPGTSPSLLLQSELDSAPAGAWAVLRSNPSYFWRGAPLGAATVLSVLFLGWAGSNAASRMSPVANTLPPGTAATGATAAPENAVPQPNATASPLANNPANNGPAEMPRPVNVPGRTPAGGFPINNRSVVARAPGTGAQPAPAPSAPLPAPAVRRPTPPRFPAVQVAPAPVLSGGASTGGAPVTNNPVRTEAALPPVNTGASGGGGSVGAMPPPRLGGDNPPVTFSPVLPPVDQSGAAPAAGASSGGAPVNPAGSPARGYIRVANGRLPASAAPARPGTAARADETRAASSARGGQTDAAISRLTSAINSSDPGEVGFRYQQRATLFLERGDYARAADDFQSAIGAYNDQIARGEDVAAARAGLRAARSGYNLATSRR